MGTGRLDGSLLVVLLGLEHRLLWSSSWLGRLLRSRLGAEQVIQEVHLRLWLWLSGRHRHRCRLHRSRHLRGLVLLGLRDWLWLNLDRGLILLRHGLVYRLRRLRCSILKLLLWGWLLIRVLRRRSILRRLLRLV